MAITGTACKIRNCLNSVKFQECSDTLSARNLLLNNVQTMQNLFFLSVLFGNYCQSVIFATKFKDFYTFYIFMSVGWDVKWCPVSRITTSLARKRLFHKISMKSRLVRAVRETLKFQNQSHFTNNRRRYKAEILVLAIRQSSASIQSINIHVQAFCQWTVQRLSLIHI